MARRFGDTGERMAANDRRQLQVTPRMLVLYFVLAFGITWSILIPALAIVPEDGQILFFILAAFGPFLAAVITIWASKGRAELGQWLRQVLRLRLPVILYLAGAFFLLIGVGLLHYGLYRVLGGEPDFSDAIPWYLYLLYLLPTALLTGGNEEPGWRGFALPVLLERFHPVLATLILGVAHAAWHLPLMGHYDTTFDLYLFGLIPLTCIFNWLYLKSQKSVIPVALFHAGTNVIGSFIPMPMDVLGGVGTFVFLRAVVYWGIAIVLLIVTRGRLGYDPTEADLV
jgi:membrane protease YdiL (CAAX protease family)